MNGTPLPHEEPQLVEPAYGRDGLLRAQIPSAQPVKLELLNSARRQLALVRRVIRL